METLANDATTHLFCFADIYTYMSMRPTGLFWKESVKKHTILFLSIFVALYYSKKYFMTAFVFYDLTSV